MKYEYDIFGWYIGEAESGRVTTIEPVNKSISNEVGLPRANWSGYAWVDMPYVQDSYAETVALSSLKEKKKSELRDAYVNTTTQSIVHDNETWAAEQSDQDLLVKALSAGAVPEGMYWRNINGTAKQMNYAALQALAKAILERALVADTNLNNKLSAVDTASSTEEVNSITW